MEHLWCLITSRLAVHTPQPKVPVAAQETLLSNVLGGKAWSEQARVASAFFPLRCEGLLCHCGNMNELDPRSRPEPSGAFYHLCHTHQSPSQSPTPPRCSHTHIWSRAVDCIFSCFFSILQRIYCNDFEIRDYIPGRINYAAYEFHFIIIKEIL